MTKHLEIFAVALVCLAASCDKRDRDEADEGSDEPTKTAAAATADATATATVAPTPAGTAARPGATPGGPTPAADGAPTSGNECVGLSETPCQLPGGRYGWCKNDRCKDVCPPGMTYTAIDAACHWPCRPRCQSCMEGGCLDTSAPVND